MKHTSLCFHWSVYKTAISGSDWKRSGDAVTKRLCKVYFSIICHPVWALEVVWMLCWLRYRSLENIVAAFFLSGVTEFGDPNLLVNLIVLNVLQNSSPPIDYMNSAAICHPWKLQYVLSSHALCSGAQDIIRSLEKLFLSFFGFGRMKEQVFNFAFLADSSLHR